jgi:glycosyltransferase involved in cell wall biosynthesis
VYKRQALESMAAGSPLIASRSGGIPEVITHGVNGFLSDIGDVESMGRDAVLLLSNPIMLNQFSHAARKQAETFDIENIVPQYENLYSKVLKG